MIIFRLISFGIRIVCTFIFVFILQIKFNGKTLEYYLASAGNKWIMIKVLNQVSQDGAKAVKGLHKNKKNKARRKISSENLMPEMIKFVQKLEMPLDKKKENKLKQLKRKLAPKKKTIGK